MKERIYTIPITEAFESECLCPVCLLQKKLEEESIEYSVGAAVMEPDFRIKTNKKGYCAYHWSKLAEQSKALPLALTLQTHAEQQNKVLDLKPSGFKKKTEKMRAQLHIENINKMLGECVICERVDYFTEKYIDNIIYLWKKEESFRSLFERQNFCLPHFAKLTEYAIKQLSDKDFAVFYNNILENEKEFLQTIYSNISEFSNLFDHRNTNTNPTPNVKGAVRRTIQVYSGPEKN